MSSPSELLSPMRRPPAAHPWLVSPLHPNLLASPTTQQLRASLPLYRTVPGRSSATFHHVGPPERGSLSQACMMKRLCQVCIIKCSAKSALRSSIPSVSSIHLRTDLVRPTSFSARGSPNRRYLLRCVRLSMVQTPPHSRLFLDLTSYPLHLIILLLSSTRAPDGVPDR
jgi:hypothetical protein